MTAWNLILFVLGAIILLLGIAVKPDNEKDKIEILVSSVGMAIFLAVLGMTDSILHALKALKVQ
jgi:hypothetical protein